jgi:DNA-binding NarL/FixJ family response regulator
MRAKLEKHPETEVVTAIEGDVTVQHLLELTRESQTDILIVDFNGRDLGGDILQLVRAATAPESSFRLLARVRRDDTILVRRLTSSRVTGCVFIDDAAILSLGDMVCRVHNGTITYSQEIYERIFRHLEVHLTDRELDVLGLLERGLSNKGIAEELLISLATVQNHISNIYSKLGLGEDVRLNRRMCAVTAARRAGLTHETLEL